MGKKENDRKPLKSVNQFARYSVLGIQMGVIIGGGTWLGLWLDEKYSDEFPLFTVICSLLGIAIALYLSLKDVISSNDN